MTICISASCNSGKSIVVASDRMLSVPSLTVEFDHQDTKIYQISGNCVALSSGDALCVQDILIGGIGAASQLQNPPIKTLAEQVKLQFCQVRKQRVNDLILGPRGIDFDGFYQGGMISRFPQDLSMLIDNQVQRYELRTEILLSGVDDSGAHIYCIGDPGTMACFDRLGYHAIGSGYRHAVLKLVAFGQHPSMTVKETIFNVFCAKRVAELAQGVGRSTSMMIVSRQNCLTIERNILEGLVPAYEQQANPTSDAIKKAIEELPYDNGGVHDTTDNP